MTNMTTKPSFISAHQPEHWLRSPTHSPTHPGREGGREGEREREGPPPGGLGELEYLQQYIDHGQ